ncbi:MAG: hypothetical protein JWM32_2179 [Verrucomicrobia bacterium]|nr:hypothetical protein [Verrucomicrobiota bacterium]
MPKTPRTYQRLTRPTSSIGSYNSLWVAKDHLLIVKSNGYSEEYQQLQLRDIQGICIVDSGRRFNWALGWGTVAAVSGLFTIGSYFAHETPWVSGVILIPSLVAFTWNQLLGAGCQVVVMTGVQAAKLPSLVRWPKARKVLARIRPLIDAAQADLLTQPVAAPVEPPPPLV